VGWGSERVEAYTAEAVSSLDTIVLLIKSNSASLDRDAPPVHTGNVLAMMLLVTVTRFHFVGSAWLLNNVGSVNVCQPGDHSTAAFGRIGHTSLR